MMLWSCAKNVVTNSTQDYGPWDIVEITKNDDRIIIRIKNKSDKPAVLYQPLVKNIQRLVNGQWLQVNTLYCDCGASCPPPPENMSLDPEEIFTITWDMQEGKCEMDNGRLTTVKTEVTEGEYRVTYWYSTEGQNEKQELNIPLHL